MAVFTRRDGAFRIIVSGGRADTKKRLMDAGRNDPARQPDDENPELTAAEVCRSRPAGDVLREFAGDAAAAKITRRRPGAAGSAGQVWGAVVLVATGCFGGV